MQVINGDVALVLRDLVDFLESLGDVDLPDDLQATRQTLLQRSRSTLVSQSPPSPEPYLDMKAGKSLLLMPTDVTEQPQEYVGAEDTQGQRGSLQHYYETFQDYQGNGIKSKEEAKTEGSSDLDNIVLLYASFSAAVAKGRSAKSGTLLHLKRERKMFAPFNVFWLNRSCWVSLVGSHLLLYANDRESRPYLVLPLDGYKIRPAPDALARDPRRSEAAFEFYCPGDRTFQFVAKNAQEMKEWVDAISENIEPDSTTKNRAKTFVEILELESNERMCIERVKEEKEKYQDVLNSPKSKTKDKSPSVKAATTLDKEKVVGESKDEAAPPLPARTRRLPSLPSQERISYEPKEEPYDEEGLYHRIEDIKAQREYQNCQIRSSELVNDKKIDTTVDLVQETYDDVHAVAESLRSEESSIVQETYDDVQSIVQNKSKDRPISYDDVQATAANLRGREKDNDKSTKSSKSPQKRSFLDRVRNRKESMRKDNDKKPVKTSTPSIPSSPTTSTSTITAPAAVATVTMSNNSEELPCYDDISSLITRENLTSTEEENYLSPIGPPRPIYSRPPTIIKCAVPNEEHYDDIGSCIETIANGCKDCTNLDVIKQYPIKNSSFLSDLQMSIDQEHYQVPNNNRKVLDYQDDTYDDVTLSATFKSRHSSTASSPEKNFLSRFGSGKKSRIFEQITRQTSCSESTDTSDDVSGEPAQHTKVKPFQKLISKMENTLGKATRTNGVTQN